MIYHQKSKLVWCPILDRKIIYFIWIQTWMESSYLFIFQYANTLSTSDFLGKIQATPITASQWIKQEVWKMGWYRYDRTMSALTSSLPIGALDNERPLLSILYIILNYLSKRHIVFSNCIPILYLIVFTIATNHYRTTNHKIHWNSSHIILFLIMNIVEGKYDSIPSYVLCYSGYCIRMVLLKPYIKK